jgi:hypothetical protein
MTIQDFIRAQGLTMFARPATANPHMAGMPAGSRHFMCEIRKVPRGGLASPGDSQRLAGERIPSMLVPFSQGPALKDPPELAGVLDCLASDASGVENARTFEEWCAEYGYDADSRAAERTYNAVAQQTEALRSLLGADGLRVLMYEIERL